MRVESLTFFRFVAALIVVIFHFGGAVGLSGTLVAGQQMVTFFFVLSGFVMVLAYYRKEKIILRVYWWARFARIFPVYFVALLGMVALEFYKNSEVDPLALLLNITFLQAWVSPYPLSINPPAWSLSVEMFFYFLFPLAVVWIKRTHLSPFGVLSLALGVWLMTQTVLIAALNLGFYGGHPSLSHDLIVYFPLVHLGGFLLGIAGGVWLVSDHPPIVPNTLSLALVGLSAFVVIYILENSLMIEVAVGLKLPFESGFMAPFFLAFIVSMAICRSSLTRVFSVRPLVLLGEASYSLYILQVPIAILYRAAVSRLDDVDPVLGFFVYVIFLVIISVFSFLYFEKPANRYLRYSFPMVVSKQWATLSAWRKRS